MASRFLKFFLSLSFLLSGTTPCQAHWFCAQLLHKPERKIKVHRKPLSQEQRTVLRNHPIFYHLRDSMGLGQNTQVQISPFPEFKFESSLFSGELKQAHFLKEILLEIWPQAQFKDYGKVTDQHGFRFFIHDSAEYGYFPEQNSHPKPQTIVEMSDIKMANGVFNPSKDQVLREKIGLSDVSVGHIYISDPWKIKFEKPEDKILNLKSTSQKLWSQGIDVVILSSSNIITPTHIKRVFPNFLNPIEPVLYMSSLLETPSWSQKRKPTPKSSRQKVQLEKGKKYLILNDTVGRLPEIHALSDLTLVVGPINFFEPLYMGTPTIFTINSWSKNDYEMETINKMISYAQSFPHFKYLEYLDEKPLFDKNEYNQISTQLQNFQYNYWIFSKFLDQLLKGVKEQMP